MKAIIYAVTMLAIMVSCHRTTKDQSSIRVIKVPQSILDSLAANSDSMFTKVLGGTELYAFDQYIGKNVNNTAKVIKDTAGNVRVITIVRNNYRSFFQEYYANGQAKASYVLNDQGQFNGPATFYFEDGRIEGIGNFQQGFFSGKWKRYSPDGMLIKEEVYNADGQLIN